ncbi:MAG: citryl-CoA lyase [Methylococcales bacterium]
MKTEQISSRIWNEIPEKDNPFAASVCLCRGYDVFDDLLQNASWIEYIYLLFIGEKPDKPKARLLESIALALANPGIRDHGVRAAMNGGVGGSTNAASLIAALAVGAGQLGGAREIFLAVTHWQSCGRDLSLWETALKIKDEERVADVWAEMEYPAGFDPYGKNCSRPVLQVLETLSELVPSGPLSWLKQNRLALEAVTGIPLALSGVAAAAFHDLGLTPDQAEMLYLILRLPGAAVHALEQKGYGWRKYPFFRDNLHYTGRPSELNED